jgi:hypothetical protein
MRLFFETGLLKARCGLIDAKAVLEGFASSVVKDYNQVFNKLTGYEQGQGEASKILELP